jgi:peptidoglycan/xylan/chitin deacetylase (PgdA/CDA1 family)
MIKPYLGKVKRYVSNIVDEPGIVLLYHRVINLSQDPQLLAVSPDHFYKQVKYLKEHFELLRVADFCEAIIKKNKLPRKAILLTFDDGYADNFQFALPVLESLNTQALFYISTAKIGTSSEMWWDDLERILVFSLNLPQQLKLEIKQREYVFNTQTEKSRKATYESLHRLLKYSSVSEREKAISELHHWAGVDAAGRPGHFLMTQEEVKRMSSSASAVIGAHTHNHPALAVLNYEEQLAEMLQSKKLLEDLTGQEIVHFSYPYGSKADFNDETVRAARTVGFKMVCSNYYGQVHRWTDPYRIPRILIRDWKMEDFKLKTKQFWKY